MPMFEWIFAVLPNQGANPLPIMINASHLKAQVTAALLRQKVRLYRTEADCILNSMLCLKAIDVRWLSPSLQGSAVAMTAHLLSENVLWRLRYRRRHGCAMTTVLRLYSLPSVLLLPLIFVF